MAITASVAEQIRMMVESNQYIGNAVGIPTQVTASWLEFSFFPGPPREYRRIG